MCQYVMYPAFFVYFLHNFLQICCTYLQFLEKENTRLEIEIKGTLKELGRLKALNDLTHDEVARLELSLNHSKVCETYSFYSIN